MFCVEGGSVTGLCGVGIVVWVWVFAGEQCRVDSEGRWFVCGGALCGMGRGKC
jgi:hypothetical protein